MAISDLSISSDADYYTVYWQVGSLQAQTVMTANNYLLIKTEMPITIESTIFCDELPKPIVSTYKVNPSPQTVKVTSNDLKDKKKYDSLWNEHIMGGHIDRVVKEWEYEGNNQI